MGVFIGQKYFSCFWCLVFVVLVAVNSVSHSSGGEELYYLSMYENGINAKAKIPVSERARDRHRENGQIPTRGFPHDKVYPHV